MERSKSLKPTSAYGLGGRRPWSKGAKPNMTTRRNFITTAVAAGVSGATLSKSTVGKAASPTRGNQRMLRGLTLLSMMQADGSETLGVKLGDKVLDVATAGKALNIDAPVTLENLLARAILVRSSVWSTRREIEMNF